MYFIHLLGWEKDLCRQYGTEIDLDTFTKTLNDLASNKRKSAKAKISKRQKSPLKNTTLLVKNPGENKIHSEDLFLNTETLPRERSSSPSEIEEFVMSRERLKNNQRLGDKCIVPIEIHDTESNVLCEKLSEKSLSPLQALNVKPHSRKRHVAIDQDK